MGWDCGIGRASVRLPQALLSGYRDGVGIGRLRVIVFTAGCESFHRARLWPLLIGRRRVVLNLQIECEAVRLAHWFKPLIGVIAGIRGFADDAGLEESSRVFQVPQQLDRAVVRADHAELGG